MRTPAGFPWRVMTTSRSSASLRYRERSSLTSESGTFFTRDSPTQSRYCGLDASTARRGLRRRLAFHRRGDSHRGNGFQASLAERAVHCPHLHRGELIKVPLDILELAAESTDATLLVCRGLAFVAQQGSIEMVGVLADAFLPGDRASLLGGDDLPPHFFELLPQRLQ